MMTVADLIARLQELPGDLPVIGTIDHDHRGWDSAGPVIRHGYRRADGDWAFNPRPGYEPMDAVEIP